MGMNWCYWPFMIYLPIYFQGGLGLDGRTVGFLLLAYTIPFLVMPPLADRLLQSRGPRVVIPLGMAVMGTGFLLMRLGSGLDQASWLTVLPGALLAGMGLGLTNTPVTATTTGAVTSNRAGMASGIDISARLITLAINIAIMGLILVEGIRLSLPDAFSGVLDGAQLQALAAATAAGNLAALPQAFPALAMLDPAGTAVHDALVQGFGWVMLYGGVGAWILAAISFTIFGPARAAATRQAAAGAAAD
jgi:hypothetical protein